MSENQKSSLRELSVEQLLKRIEELENQCFEQGGFVNGDREALGKLNWELHDRGYSYEKHVSVTLKVNKEAL